MISQRNIGVSDREIFARKNYFIFPSKIGILTPLQTNFLGFFGCHSPTMQLSSGIVIVSKEITCGRLTYVMA